MVMQRGYDPSERGVLQEPTSHSLTSYTSGQQTEGLTQIFVYNSQHTTNYVSLPSTGEVPEQLQKQLSGSSGVQINTLQRVEEMCTILGEMKSTLDDPASFEEKIARLLGCLAEIEDKASQRESHFQDLVCLLRMILSTVEAEELNDGTVSAITDVVTGLCKTVTEQELRDFRERLRRSGLDLLRPFRIPLDVRAILQEMFPDENPA